MRRFWVVALFATSSALLEPMSGAQAKCRHEPSHWKFGKTVSVLWSTDEEAVCTARNIHPEKIEKIEIASKPKHGTAGVADTESVAYKPNWGYRGSDMFTYIIFSNANAKNGAGRVARVNVFVDVR
jgi:hypothetical protein